eukprot:CAMPEP_0115079126 /NCGR_PEP_ID=MMETSP0227-20121206/17927_1 /TAXON_ID=89957 /ORGANISM="Polarella glacialis, Strain CCMP 1383" /LENGTH=223 /DNA_ID=CAMNT_0002466579 /DNA_START=15 /DNA_END=688 /DNA_ORIENTATION=-
MGGCGNTTCERLLSAGLTLETPGFQPSTGNSDSAAAVVVTVIASAATAIVAVVAAVVVTAATAATAAAVLGSAALKALVLRGEDVGTALGALPVPRAGIASTFAATATSTTAVGVTASSTGATAVAAPAAAAATATALCQLNVHCTALPLRSSYSDLNLTLSPSWTLPSPSKRPVTWQKKSSPPSSGWMNPKPFSLFQRFMVPVGMAAASWYTVKPKMQKYGH